MRVLFFTSRPIIVLNLGSAFSSLAQETLILKVAQVMLFTPKLTDQSQLSITLNDQPDLSMKLTDQSQGCQPHRVPGDLPEPAKPDLAHHHRARGLHPVPREVRVPHPVTMIILFPVSLYSVHRRVHCTSGNDDTLYSMIILFPFSASP